MYSQNISIYKPDFHFIVNFIVDVVRRLSNSSPFSENRQPPSQLAMASSLTAPSWEDVVHPALLDLSRCCSSPDKVVEWVLAHADEAIVLAGVLSIPVFSDAGAARLSALTTDLVGMGGDAVGSMHRYGTDLMDQATKARQPGFQSLLDSMQRALEPVLDALFISGGSAAGLPASGSDGGWAPQRLRCVSGHAIAYGVEPGRERALRLHVDDSLVTVNVCLGVPGFTGSELHFSGSQELAWPALARAQRKQRAAAGPGADAVDLRVRPVPGRALLHFGRHPHRTAPIESGTRVQWVNWYQLATPPAAAVSVAADAGADSEPASGAVAASEAAASGTA